MSIVYKEVIRTEVYKSRTKSYQIKIYEGRQHGNGLYLWNHQIYSNNSTVINPAPIICEFSKDPILTRGTATVKDKFKNYFPTKLDFSLCDVDGQLLKLFQTMEPHHSLRPTMFPEFIYRNDTDFFCELWEGTNENFNGTKKRIFSGYVIANFKNYEIETVTKSISFSVVDGIFSLKTKTDFSEFFTGSGHPTFRLHSLREVLTKIFNKVFPHRSMHCHLLQSLKPYGSGNLPDVINFSIPLLLQTLREKNYLELLNAICKRFHLRYFQEDNIWHIQEYSDLHSSRYFNISTQSYYLHRAAYQGVAAELFKQKSTKNFSTIPITSIACKTKYSDTRPANAPASPTFINYFFEKTVNKKNTDVLKANQNWALFTANYQQFLPEVLSQITVNDDAERLEIHGKKYNRIKLKTNPPRILYGELEVVWFHKDRFVDPPTPEYPGIKMYKVIGANGSIGHYAVDEVEILASDTQTPIIFIQKSNRLFYSGEPLCIDLSIQGQLIRTPSEYVFSTEEYFKLVFDSVYNLTFTKNELTANTKKMLRLAYNATQDTPTFEIHLVAGKALVKHIYNFVNPRDTFGMCLLEDPSKQKESTKTTVQVADFRKLLPLNNKKFEFEFGDYAAYENEAPTVKHINFNTNKHIYTNNTFFDRMPATNWNSGSPLDYELAKRMLSVSANSNKGYHFKTTELLKFNNLKRITFQDLGKQRDYIMMYQKWDLLDEIQEIKVSDHTNWNLSISTETEIEYKEKG